ncbi:MAG: class I SAM-dependent methyltransferase [Cyclobacteriaceae bacterium]|nr:class I SAM-dependent methyltransferase [Cyclobacteriaceae bacterium]
MDILHPDLLRYAEQHTSPESDLLKHISRETHAHVLRPRMLSGHLQGRLLAMLSRMLRPKSILEIGTYTGYSAICLAEGLAPGGKLITVDSNEELEDTVRAYLKQAGLEQTIDYRIGNALEIVPKLSGPFDLVFIDADKENYHRYYDFVFNLVPLGGYILADNVLWSGKVLQSKPDKDTRAIQEFNEKIQNDSRVENLLLPVRDGIMIARKVKE